MTGLGSPQISLVPELALNVIILTETPSTMTNKDWPFHESILNSLNLIVTE